MQTKITLTNNILVDFLIPVANKGGVENCLNMVCSYLTKKKIKVRVIQIVYGGSHWLDESLDYYHLLENDKAHTVQEYKNEYARFLKENGIPTLVVATAWPLCINVAKSALSSINADSPVFSYMHSPYEMYERAGVASLSHLSSADIHLAISDEIADFISKNVETPKIYRVNNPLKASNIHPVSELSRGTLLFVGRLAKEKRIDFILEALSKTTSKWNLRIVGDGDMTDFLKEKASDLQISERVDFVGWSDDPWKYAKGSYALIMSSEFEGSPLVAFEALSCGLPVIGNVSSRVSEIVTDGVNGFVYNDDDMDQLVGLLDNLYNSEASFDPEACRLSVVSHLPEIALFDLYIKLYASANHRFLLDNLYKAGNDIIQEKISIIIPCYNAEAFIPRCLDSVVSQTIGMEHLELIIVNDCSTDNSLQIIEEYEKTYPENICIVNLDENGGQSIARNVGLSYASGDYVIYVDADDCLDKNMILQMYLTISCYPAEIVSCDYTSFEDAILSDIDISGEIPLTLTIAEKSMDRRRLFMDQSFTTAPWGKLIRRSFLEKNSSIFFPDHAHMEDIYFTYMLIGAASSWCHVSLPLYNYFVNPKGTMKSDKIKDYYMDVHDMFALAMTQYVANGFYAICRQELAFMYYKKVFIDLTRFMLGRFEDFPVENYIVIRDYMLQYFPDFESNPYLPEEDKKTIEKFLALDS